MTIPLTERSSGCACGHDHDELPELDARTIPHAIRHGAVIGSLQQLRPGAAMALIAPHDPKPLLAQIQDLLGDQVTITYLVSGPESWKIKLARA